MFLSGKRKKNSIDSAKSRYAVKARKNQKHRRGKLISTGYLLPSVVGVLIFFVLPFFIVIYYSVVDNPISGQFVFLDNFMMVFRNGAFRTAALNTLVFSLTAVPLAVVLSLLLAMMLDAKIPFKSQFRTFFLSPMMVPIASVVLIWQVLFHYNGTVNEFLKLFDAEKIDWLNSAYAQVVLVLLFLWKNLPFSLFFEKYFHWTQNSELIFFFFSVL